MFIPRILVSLCMPSFQEKSLVMINCLVNYSGVVKVHIMAKLVCVSRNFRIAVANKDSSSISTKPCGKCCIRLALICNNNNNNNNTLFTHATSRSDKNSLKHVRETESIENKRNSLKLPF